MTRHLMGLVETRLANHRIASKRQQRPFAWGFFPGKGSQTGTSGTRAATCAWPPPRIDAYSSLIPATRRESSRTDRKYEAPNHVVTQSDWQPLRRVENPRPK